MGLVRVTAYPSRYANEAQASEPVICGLPVGSFYFRFSVARGKQRMIAMLIGEALKTKPTYQRQQRMYEIGAWAVIGKTVLSESFSSEDVDRVLRVLGTLGNVGLEPDGEISILFKPETYDAHLIFNLCNIMEARSRLIAQALGLNEEIRIVIDRDLTFSIPLNAFDLDALEACVYLLRQASRQAAAVGKARMRECDERNPKFQMRSWLLRLGFIGGEFARPRQTLLRSLKGDGAFFNEQSRSRAAVRRKAVRAKEAVL